VIERDGGMACQRGANVSNPSQEGKMLTKINDDDDDDM